MARESLIAQLARLGLSNLVPLAVWRRDRPWTIRSVQWFLFFTLFPLFLVAWTALAGSGFSDVAYLYAIYFATIWGLVLWLFIRPEKIGLLDVVRVALFSSITGAFLATVLYRLPWISVVVAASRDPSLLLRLPGNILGVGIVEELVKAIPVLWIFMRNREPGTTREIVYLGCVSGFAFGVTEAVMYSVVYAQNVVRGGIPLGAYMVLQLTRLITLPLLHAVFSGIAAQFVALGVQTPALARALVLAGIVIAAFVHGLYNAFSGSLLGFAIAVGEVLVFIAYVRSIDSMRLAVERAARDGEAAATGP